MDWVDSECVKMIQYIVFDWLYLCGDFAIFVLHILSFMLYLIFFVFHSVKINQKKAPLRTKHRNWTLLGSRWKVGARSAGKSYQPDTTSWSWLSQCSSLFYVFSCWQHCSPSFCASSKTCESEPGVRPRKIKIGMRLKSWSICNKLFLWNFQTNIYQ